MNNGKIPDISGPEKVEVPTRITAQVFLKKDGEKVTAEGDPDFLIEGKGYCILS